MEVDPSELAVEVDEPAGDSGDQELAFDEIALDTGNTERTFDSSLAVSSIDDLDGLPVGETPATAVEFELDPADEAVAESLGMTSPAPARGGGAAAAGATPAGLEDDLDEADFFVSQNLFEEARAILNDLLARHPGHPLILAKLHDLDGQSGAGKDRPAPGTLPPAAAPAEGHGHKPAVIAKGLSGPDLDTHYDLGLAYKEMGLYDEAIREFALVREAPGRAVQCFLMIGLCHVERGKLTEAVEQFKAGLYVENINEREALALYFELGAAYEGLGDAREALYYFEKVHKRDPGFRDVERRIEALRRGAPPPRPNGGGPPKVARPGDREDSADEAMRAIDSLGEHGPGDLTPA